MRTRECESTNGVSGLRKVIIDGLDKTIEYSVDRFTMTVYNVTEAEAEAFDAHSGEEFCLFDILADHTFEVDKTGVWLVHWSDTEITQ